ncbi:hypothetical protein PR202_gb20969 [Eleusine coracana subsp. coracana]|uniref:protein-serine/threonine phosphatase n=1 Tax=Eleusine coracana subsp. coracana TaxID=191504 RepID=A0AAV5FC15_ELECO|nr:hypothetical protein QOZ80_7BG0600870 [Eleusine coracana subsp. coracana]GJN32456.1 hypothetical protein PR202_gb20969 [Eleusine coracana subsp. coracana]
MGSGGGLAPGTPTRRLHDRDVRAYVSRRPTPELDPFRRSLALAFGDRSIKEHISSNPDVAIEDVDDDAELVVLASDGLWKVMSNQEAVDEVRGTGDARKAAARLVDEAVRRGSKDDVSCIVVKLH